MRDKRPVDELSIEELERILAIKKREARQTQLARMKRSGRVVASKTAAAPASTPTPEKAPAAQTGQSVPKPAPATDTDNELPQFEDDSDLLALPPVRVGKTQSGLNTRRLTNTILTLVEVAAVMGLLFLGLNMAGAIDTLERETANAQSQSNATRQASIPTLEPTPTLRVDRVVLPGGHAFDENGQVFINYSEIPDTIPDHLLPVVRNSLLRPTIERPARTPETALRIQIPALEIDETIVQGTDWEALQQGVGQVLNGYDPTDPFGNIALAAHNDIYGEIFRHLDQLEAGDEFYIFTEAQVYTYRITHTERVAPTDVHVLESRGKATATLISCYPYRVNTERYIIYADRVDAF